MSPISHWGQLLCQKALPRLAMARLVTLAPVMGLPDFEGRRSEPLPSRAARASSSQLTEQQTSGDLCGLDVTCALVCDLDVTCVHGQAHASKPAQSSTFPLP